MLLRPGDELPSRDARAAMLRDLLRVRFKFAFHLEDREVIAVTKRWAWRLQLENGHSS